MSVAFLLILAGCSGLSLYAAGRLLPYRGDTTGLESLVPFYAYRFLHGGAIYSRGDQPPYSVAIYGPLAYLSEAAVGWAAQPKGFVAFLIEGRVFYFLLFLCIPVLGYRWARRCGVRRSLAMAAPLLVLCDRTMFPWNLSQRPDFGALLLALAGFFVLTAQDGKELVWRRVAGAGFLMGLAFSFKQPYLAAPAAAAVWLLGQRRFRLTAVLAGAALAPAIAIIAWLEWHGNAVLYGLLVARHVVYDVHGELVMIGQLLLTSPMVIIQAGLGLAGWWALRKRERRVGQLAGLYLALAAAIGLVTMSQSGAHIYYLMEATTLCSFLAPMGLESLDLAVRKERMGTRIAVALLLVGLSAASSALWIRDSLAKWADWGRFPSVLEGRRILSDQPFLASLGKQPEMGDPNLMSLLEQGGKWSPAPVVEQIAQQKFDFIALRVKQTGDGDYTFWPAYRNVPIVSPEILAATERDYRQAGACGRGGVLIFVPRKGARGPELARLAAGACAGWLDAAQDRDRFEAFTPAHVESRQTANSERPAE